ncbi:hypothetical protein B296_00002069 [Ensete ventricosum]|uniref:Uncharacterized protein n=1 Tax=Ensete ventricosum TaxID=4639 RepID=A0A427AW44_ENSVE|nr:hypothetical protein B296_00002069 [Ensete ventricosum]
MIARCQGPLKNTWSDVAWHGIMLVGLCRVECMARLPEALAVINILQEPEITFEMGEAEYPDHDDNLVISVKISNAQVKRVMVVTENFTDVLYLDAF